MTSESHSEDPTRDPGASHYAESYRRFHRNVLRLLLAESKQVLLKLRESSLTSQAEMDTLLVLYLHMIEMADAVDVLLSQSATAPAWLQVRSLFEALLAIEYILQQDGEQRSLAWQYFYLSERLAQTEKHDPSTQRGQQWIKDVGLDEVGERLSPPPRSLVAKELARFNKALSACRFKSVRRMCREHKGKYDRAPRHWYSVGGGPRNLRDLARSLGHAAKYSALYGYWSEIGHAKDMGRLARRTSGGRIRLGRIRNPQWGRGVVTTTVDLLLAAGRQIAGRIGIQEELTEWYLREFREVFLHHMHQDPEDPAEEPNGQQQE